MKPRLWAKMTWHSPAQEDECFSPCCFAIVAQHKVTECSFLNVKGIEEYTECCLPELPIFERILHVGVKELKCTELLTTLPKHFRDMHVKRRFSCLQVRQQRPVLSDWLMQVGLPSVHSFVVFSRVCSITVREPEVCERCFYV